MTAVILADEDALQIVWHAFVVVLRIGKSLVEIVADKNVVRAVHNAEKTAQHDKQENGGDERRSDGVFDTLFADDIHLYCSNR